MYMHENSTLKTMIHIFLIYYIQRVKKKNAFYNLTENTVKC